MWRLFEIVLCLAGMALVYGALHWLFVSTSKDFGIGVGVGVVLGAGAMGYAIYAGIRDGHLIRTDRD